MTDTARELRRLARVLERHARTAEAAAIAWHMAATGTTRPRRPARPNGDEMSDKTTVLGWRSPWSGDENDRIPWTYWIWVRAHWADMRLRHRFGRHAWQRTGLGFEHCDWCGARR